MKPKRKPFNEYIGRAMTLRSIGFKSYAEYLASPMWESIRRRVFERDGGTCRICKGPANVAHHNQYGRKVMIGKTLKSIRSVVCLCHDCHRLIEFDRDGNKEKLLSNVRNKFFLLSRR